MQGAPREEREFGMLSLNLKEGEYVTIGEDIVVQTFPFGSQTQVLIEAPRELTILRGKLHERSGDAKPDSLVSGKRKPSKSPSDLRHSAKRLEKLAAYQAKKDDAKAAIDEIGAMLNTMGETQESKWLRQRLERIAPLVE